MRTTKIEYRTLPAMRCPLRDADCIGIGCMWALVERDMAGGVTDVTCAVSEIGRSVSRRTLGTMGVRERGRR